MGRPPGRKPKPPQLKILEGNPGKRPVQSGGGKPKRGCLRPPPFLDPTARQEWTRIVGELDRLQVFTALDWTTLACYCQTYSRMIRAERALAKAKALVFETPNGALQQRPEIGIINKCQRQLQAWAGEFGFTPCSRMRIEFPEAEEGDEFDKWANGQDDDEDEPDEAQSG